MSDQGQWDETRRLDPEEPGTQPPDPTRRLEPGARYDAVGDTTYEEPYPPRQEPVAAGSDPEPDRRGNDGTRGRGWRDALLLLLGAGVGFVAALIVVALFGQTGDAAAVAARDSRIATLEDELAEAQRDMEDLESTLQQRDEQIADLQAGQEDAEGGLARRQEELDQRERALDDREQELEEREQALEEPEDPGEPEGDDGLPDVDLPDVDDEDARALIDRVIEGIRDLFR